MSESKNITLWCVIPFKDADGHHNAGKQFSMPYETEVQQAEVQSLLTYGIASKTAPEGEKPAPKKATG